MARAVLLWLCRVSRSWKVLIPLKTVKKNSLISALCLFFNLLFAANAQGQSYVWAKGEGGIGNDAANGIAVDDFGNSYITGNLAGLAEFTGTTVQGVGLYDIILVKYNLFGNLTWAKSAGGIGNDQGNVIKYKDGFLYIAGSYEDTASFLPNGSIISKGEADAFVAKYDLDGNLVWLNHGGGINFDYASGLDVDDDGNVYICGTYETSATFDTSVLTTSNLFAESFIAKYNSNGSLVWAKTTAGSTTNLITGIACGNNSLYITGFFGGSFSLDASTINSATPSYDVLLARLDLDGQLMWLKRAGSTYEDAANAIAANENGTVAIAGYFAGTAYFDNHGVTYLDYNDVFVANYDSAGNNLWVRAGKGGQLDVAFALTSDASGNIFSTGMFENSIDFDGNVLSGNGRDIFLNSYDAAGNLRWLSSAGGIQTNCGLGIAVKADEDIALCGYYLHTCSFGNIDIDYANNNDLFIAEYDPPVVSSVQEAVSAVNFGVFPTVCVGCSHLHVKTSTTGPYDLQLYDVSGRLVEERNSVYEPTLNVSEFLPGVYFLCMTDNGGRHTARFIIE